MPASLPIRPLGRVVSILAICWVPSARAIRSEKGLKRPAWGLLVPAEKLGVLGASASEAGQAPPRGETEVAKASLVLTS